MFALMNWISLCNFFCLGFVIYVVNVVAIVALTLGWWFVKDVAIGHLTLL